MSDIPFVNKLGDAIDRYEAERERSGPVTTRL